MVIAVIFGIVMAGIAAFLVFKARQELARLKLVKDTPTTPSTEVSSGAFVEVKGTVEAEQTVISPFYQQPAVYCSWKVEEYRQGHGKNRSGHWVTVMHGAEGKDFYIRDEWGRIRVRATAGDARPTLYLTPGTSTRSGTFNDAQPHIEQFLQAHGRSSQGWIFNKSMRYSEELIRPGEPIYALGRAHKTSRDVEMIPGKASELILANLTEEQLTSRLGRNGYFMMIGGVVLGLGGVAVMFLPLFARLR